MLMKDLFDKIYKDKGPLGKWAEQAEGYFVFPKLEGEISNRMKFQGKEVITWSINDYLGLANHILRQLQHLLYVLPGGLLALSNH